MKRVLEGKEKKLWFAMRYRDLAEVRRLADAGVNFTVRDSKDWTLLFWAAVDGKRDVFEWLVEKADWDWNARSDFGLTPLMMAANCGNLEIVTRLAELGADVFATSYTGDTAVHFAAYRGRQDVLAWLADQGVDLLAPNNYRQTPLYYAIREGHRDVAMWLLERGAGTLFTCGDTKKIFCDAHSASRAQGFFSRGRCPVVPGNDWATILSAAMAAYNDDLLFWMMENGPNLAEQDGLGETLLHKAARAWLFPLVKWLVKEKGLDVFAEDDLRRTVLMAAAEGGNIRIVRWLTEEKKLDVHAVDDLGRTVLHHAAMSGNLPLVKWLVDKKGLDVFAVDEDGDSVLYWAMWGKDLPLAKWLVEKKGLVPNDDILVEAWEQLDVLDWLVNEKGRNINAVNQMGDTVLSRASKGMELRVVAWIVEDFGADPNFRLPEGMTALHNAAALGTFNVVRYLVEHGADVNAVNDFGYAPLHFAHNDAIREYLTQFCWY